MMDFIAAIKPLLDLVESGGIVALLIFMVWAFFSGNLVSRRTVEDIVASIVSKVDEKMDALKADIEKKLDGRGEW